MKPDRRAFLNFAAAGVVTGISGSVMSMRSAGNSKVKAIAFDAFPIFDLRPVFALTEHLFPGKGFELTNSWRTRQFEYQWLRALSGRYADFWKTTEDSLMFAAELLKLDLTIDKRKKLMSAYLELKAWPDVPSVLKSLKRSGLRMAFLSNATATILCLVRTRLRPTSRTLVHINWRSMRSGFAKNKFSSLRLRVGMRPEQSLLVIRRTG
jgi:2-haloacid dehalogenase